jgi:hypothetical protein
MKMENITMSYEELETIRKKVCLIGVHMFHALGNAHRCNLDAADKASDKGKAELDSLIEILNEHKKNIK